MSLDAASQCLLDITVEEDDEKYIPIYSSISTDEGGTMKTQSQSDGDSRVPDRKDRKYIQKVIRELQQVKEWHGSSDAVLEDEPFYHGYMARTESERVLTKNGEFLLRKAEVRGKECYIVSVQWGDKKLHLKIQKVNKFFFLNVYCFISVENLIRYHMALKAPVYEDVILKSYVVREQWQLYHEQVHIDSSIGHGAFGEVFKGTLTVGVFTRPIEVAIKTLKSGNFSTDDRITFLREANVMLKLQHKYVVRLYGVATQKEPIMIVMELATGGSLLNKVRKEEVDLSRKRKYCFQTICGMQYLEQQNVMHRDLAARNCLIGVNDTCKISDFGLSLMGHSHKEKHLLKVPIRWLAPETMIRGLYSNKSDVWSCGVLMFEVFSNGEVPYKHISKLSEVRREVIFGSLRLKPPRDMPPEDAGIMLSCFENNPLSRPSFDDLKRAYKSSCGVGKLQRMMGWFAADKAEIAPVKT